MPARHRNSGRSSVCRYAKLARPAPKGRWARGRAPGIKKFGKKKMGRLANASALASLAARATNTPRQSTLFRLTNAFRPRSQPTITARPQQAMSIARATDEPQPSTSTWPEPTPQPYRPCAGAQPSQPSTVLVENTQSVEPMHPELTPGSSNGYATAFPTASADLKSKTDGKDGFADKKRRLIADEGEDEESPSKKHNVVAEGENNLRAFDEQPPQSTNRKRSRDDDDDIDHDGGATSSSDCKRRRYSF